MSLAEENGLGVPTEKSYILKTRFEKYVGCPPHKELLLLNWYLWASFPGPVWPQAFALDDCNRCGLIGSMSLCPAELSWAVIPMTSAEIHWAWALPADIHSTHPVHCSMLDLWMLSPALLIAHPWPDASMLIPSLVMYRLLSPASAQI